MTKATKADRTRRRRLGRFGLAAGMLLATLSGCTAGNTLLTQFVPPWQMQAPDTKLFPTDTPKDTPKEAMVLRGNGLEQAEGTWHPAQEKLAAAKQLLDQKKFAEAEKAFHEVAMSREPSAQVETPGFASQIFKHKGKEVPEQFREEALFFEAECQRLQKHYRGAEETYSQLVKEFPSTQYTERTDKALFAIAVYWLADTRQQMKEYEEQRQGKRWLVLPASFVHFSVDMPVMDAEGHAVRVLEGIQVREK